MTSLSPPQVDQLLDELLVDYSTPEQILGEQGLLKQLTKRLVERALKAELSHHLETEAQTSPGELALSIPHDRNSTFEPMLVPKGERRLSGLDDKIIAMYARGLSTRDIQAQLEELSNSHFD